MPDEDDWGCFRRTEGLTTRPKGRTEPGLLSPSWEAVGSYCSAATDQQDRWGGVKTPTSQRAKATHSSVVAWRIPGMGQPGGLPSMGLQQQQQHPWVWWEGSE